jgi:dephospho-CoA kinase
LTYIVGLTGGIGSGKSAAADLFAQLGATIVDADLIAHALTAPNGVALAGIRNLFGDQAIAADGAMDRSMVRQRVFDHPEERASLEQLLHPLIRAESARQIAAANGPYVVHVIPLLVESRDTARHFDRIAVVDCPESMQVERVRQRSKLADAQIQRIMQAQATRAQRLAAADDVIDNSGTREALLKRIEELHAQYCAAAHQSA